MNSIANLGRNEINYLNVPINEKATNSHSVMSGNSGGTSRLNNYLWSECEDVTNEESIQLTHLINKELNLLTFQDVREKIKARNDFPDNSSLPEIEENVTDIITENCKDIKVFLAKTAFPKLNK